MCGAFESVVQVRARQTVPRGKSTQKNEKEEEADMMKRKKKGLIATMTRANRDQQKQRRGWM